MPIPASGPISMSMLNVELGRASNTANSALAGASTPSVGSLFWLGAQSGSLNQTAPHQMSEWYGYTANLVTVPAPFIKIDAASSSFIGTTVSNVGNGGSTYDLTAFDGLALGGTGTSSFFNFIGGFKALTSSLLPFNLSASSFTIDLWLKQPGNQTGSYYFLGNTASYSGIQASIPGGEPTKIQILPYWSGSFGGSNFGTGSLVSNAWSQVTFVYEYKALPAVSTGSLYINNVLANVVVSATALNTGSYILYIGRGRSQQLFEAYATASIANFSLWTSSLSTGSINLLYNEFDRRY